MNSLILSYLEKTIFMESEREVFFSQICWVEWSGAATDLNSIPFKQDWLTVTNGQIDVDFMPGSVGEDLGWHSMPLMYPVTKSAVLICNSI